MHFLNFRVEFYQCFAQCFIQGVHRSISLRCSVLDVAIHIEPDGRFGARFPRRISLNDDSKSFQLKVVLPVFEIFVVES